MPERHQNSAGGGPDAREPLAPDAEAARLLVERGRLGLGITLAALFVLWVTDGIFYPTVIRALTAITLLQAAFVGFGVRALGRATRRRQAAAIPILVLGGVFATGVASDVLSANPAGTGLSALVACMISATLMPWGVWFQTTLVLVTAVPSGLTIWFCTGSLETVGYAAGPGAIVLLASISVASAFERARHARVRVERELRLLQAVSLAVGAAPDPESALETVLRHVCQASGWALGQAWTPRDDGQALQWTAGWTVDDGTLRHFQVESRRYLFARGVGLPGRVWDSARPAWVTDVRVDPSFPRAEAARALGLTAGMAMPVVADGEVIAVLEFFVRTPHREDEHLVALFAGAAIQLGAVIKRKRAERALAVAKSHAEEEAQIAATLVGVGQTLSTHLGKPEMLERVSALAASALGCDWSATFMWNDERDALRPVASAGHVSVRSGARLPSLPADERALAAGRLVEVSPMAPEAAGLAGLRERLGVGAALCAPVSLAGTVIGAQIHAYRGRPQPFSDKQRRLATGIADATAIAVANARLIDDLQSSSRLKSEFVATMSHELRTPLNIIVGYSDMLAEGVVGALSAEQSDTIARVQRASAELLDLVNATLDMGRIEAGRESVTREVIDVAALLAQLDVELGPLVAPAVELRWIDQLTEPEVVTDKAKLKTVLKNLVGNALKFTARGHVDAVVSWRDDRLTVVVRDTGVGIAAEHLPVIFEMFRQGDASSTRTFGGVGLGLHIVRRLVALLGGEVAVQSTVGVGSTFTASWPAPRLAVYRGTGT